MNCDKVRTSKEAACSPTWCWCTCCIPFIIKLSDIWHFLLSLFLSPTISLSLSLSLFLPYVTHFTMFHFVVGLVQFSYKSLTVSFCNVQWQRCKCEKCKRILQSQTEKSLELVSKDIIDCLLTLAIYSRINNEYKRQRNPELGTATTTTKNMKTWCSTKATTTITMCLSIQLNSTCWRLSSKHHFSCTQSVRSRRQQKQYCYIQQQCTHTHICIFKYMSVLGEDGMATNIVDIPYNSQIGKCNVRQR